MTWSLTHKKIIGTSAVYENTIEMDFRDAIKRVEVFSNIFFR